MVSSNDRILELSEGYYDMPDGLIPILLIIAGVVVYTVLKVVENVRISKRQWEEVDKSKLKTWDDEDD